jgi:EpsI family protein
LNFGLLARSKFVRVLTVVLIAQAGLFYAASRGEGALFALPLSAFPVQVGSWKLVQEGVIEKETLDILKADDTLTRFYAGPEGMANLFLAFFKTQRYGQSPHSPKNCLPGSGWQPSESGRVDVETSLGTIRINRYLVAKGEVQSLVYYWYQSQGRVIADEFAAKFYLIEDSIRKHRSDTALVRVVVPVDGNGIDRAEKTGVEFVKMFYPAVRGYLPQ